MVFCSCGSGPRAGSDVERKEKSAEGPAAFGSGGKKNHPWADWQVRSTLEPSAHQAIAPGACRGWRRHLLAHIRAQKEPSFSPLGTASNTADHEGSPGGSRSLASHRGTLRRGGKMQISRTRGRRFAEKLPSGPAAGTAGRDAHTDKRRRCALGVPQGVRDMGHAADGGHGSRGAGSVRSLCGRCCAGARHRAWTRRFRPATCLCSRDSDCTTRRGRSCRCAGASVRRTAGKRVPGEP